MEKTFCAKMLEKIQATMLERIDGDVESYSIEGRDIAKIPMEQLVEMESKYKALVQHESDDQDIAAGLKSNPNKIVTKFL